MLHLCICVFVYVCMCISCLIISLKIAVLWDFKRKITFIRVWSAPLNGSIFYLLFTSAFVFLLFFCVPGFPDGWDEIKLPPSFGGFCTWHCRMETKNSPGSEISTKDRWRVCPATWIGGHPESVCPVQRVENIQSRIWIPYGRMHEIGNLQKGKWVESLVTLLYTTLMTWPDPWFLSSSCDPEPVIYNQHIIIGLLSDTWLP